MDLEYDLSKDGGKKRVSENQIKNSVLKYLKTIQGLKCHKRGASLSQNGEPDITGCYKGLHFEIELKAPGKKPTVLQQKKMDEWEKAGAIVFWADSLQTVKQQFEIIILPLGDKVGFLAR
jgi:hypothetical protein